MKWLVYLLLVAMWGVGIGLWLYARRRAKRSRVAFCEDETPIKHITKRESMRVGEVMSYAHEVYGSLGLYYEVECDKDAFELKYNTLYEEPEEVRNRMCGADKGIHTVIFKALKPGLHTIKIQHIYRGNIQKVVIYKVNVKN